MTPILAGPPLALRSTLFEKWLPGCYKGNRSKVREACFCIPCSSGQLRCHYTNTTLAVQELTYPTYSSLPRTITPFITASVRQSQNSLYTPETWAQTVPCIQQPWSPLDKSSLIEGNPVHAKTHTPILFFICQAEWYGCKWFSLICSVWRCTQTRECVCLLVGEERGVGMENPDLDWT